MTLKVKRTTDCNLPLPKYQTVGASGFDLQANLDRPVEIGPHQHYPIGCGFAFEIPEGYELQIRPRSGLAFKFQVMTSFGTIDSDYRGEVKLNMMNYSSRFPKVICHGDRIAQAVLVPVTRAQLEEVGELDTTNRGQNGFGSTGS